MCIPSDPPIPLLEISTKEQIRQVYKDVDNGLHQRCCFLCNNKGHRRYWQNKPGEMLKAEHYTAIKVMAQICIYWCEERFIIYIFKVIK